MNSKTLFFANLFALVVKICFDSANACTDLGNLHLSDAARAKEAKIIVYAQVSL